MLGMFPILSFQTPTDGVWLENGMGCVVAKDISEDKSGETEAVSSAANTDVSRTKEDHGYDCEAPLYTSEANELSKNVPANPNSPEGRDKIASEFRRSVMKSGIQGEFQTLGVPSLRPGEVVEVSGFEVRGQPPKDALFNGPYGVINVKHSAGVGGFTTSFTGIMDFFPEAFLEAATKAKGETTKSVPIDEGATDAGKKGKVNKKSKDTGG